MTRLGTKINGWDMWTRERKGSHGFEFGQSNRVLELCSENG